MRIEDYLFYVHVLGIVPKSRAKVCEQDRMSLSIPTSRSKAVIWCNSY